MIDEGKIYRYFKKAEKLAASVGDKPLFLGFSGGKDSIVLKYYADKFNIKYEARYNNTQIEEWTGMLPFIKKHYPDVVIVNPDRKDSFFKLMERKGEPSLWRRWCCDALKHGNPKNKEYKIGVFGVRGDESRARQKRGEISVLNNSQRAQKRAEHLKGEFARQDTEIKCYGDHGEKVNIYPIFDLTDDEVWDIIKENNLPIPEPYLKGTKRIGCALCPFATKTEILAVVKNNPNLVKHWMVAKQKQYLAGFVGGAGQTSSAKFLQTLYGGGDFDVVGYFWLFVNKKTSSWEVASKALEDYYRIDMYGNSAEKDFRALLTKNGIIREDGKINL